MASAGFAFTQRIPEGEIKNLRKHLFRREQSTRLSYNGPQEAGTEIYNENVISIVIPCFNEAQGLRRVIPRLPRWIDQILVVDNGSTDGTGAVARQLGAQVVHEPNRGYGQACLAGFRQCRGDIIGILDGDDSYPAEGVGPLVERVADERLDVLFCSRFPLRNSPAMPRIRRLGNRLSNGLVKSLRRYPWRDIHSGMWFFRRPLLPLTEGLGKGMGLSLGFKLRAARRPGLRITECWIPYRPRLGQAKFRPFKDSWEMFLVMVNPLAR
ncbi:MAG: glycosyltransferase family 2 protein [Candidatus Omnitrophica bacterium]|nr:glycosyltransferase family 2 protein [Candidatus Omnitrophota bacterium]